MPNNCSHYVNCSGLYTGSSIHTEVKKCPTCLRFNQFLGICDFVSNVPECSNGLTTLKNCTGAGTFPDTSNPYKFYVCKKDSAGNLKLYSLSCGAPSIYNPDTLECDDPENITNRAPTNECHKPGFYADQFRCNYFYMCSKINKRTLVQTNFECPPKLVYDEKGHHCSYYENVTDCKYS